jgi:hypothetical protein
MNLAHFAAATIGQKSTPKKCTVLSAVQIDFFRRRYQRSQRKQRLKKNLHLSYRTAMQTVTQMETNEENVRYCPLQKEKECFKLWALYFEYPKTSSKWYAGMGCVQFSRLLGRCRKRSLSRRCKRFG